MEREGRSCVETVNGFMTFKLINSTTSYLDEAYVVPNMRGTAIVKELLETVKNESKKLGAKTLITTVDPRAIGSNVSMLACIKYGFELYSVNDGLIYLRQELL